MSPAAQVALLWLLFAATHLGLATQPVESRITARLGRGGYLALYSAVALALFAPLVQIYFTHRHAGPWLWALPATGAFRVVVYAGLVFALALAVAANLRPSPAAVLPGPSTPGGVYRLTRHPLMAGASLLGLLHLPMNGAASDLAFFGGLALFPWLGAWHQDRRKLASGDPAFVTFHAATPFLPFTGRETLRGLREFPPLALVLALALAAFARWLHGSLW